MNSTGRVAVGSAIDISSMLFREHVRSDDTSVAAQVFVLGCSVLFPQKLHNGLGRVQRATKMESVPRHQQIHYFAY